MAQGFAFGRPAPLPTVAEVLLEELTEAPVPRIPDAPDDRLEVDELDQPHMTMPTPRQAADVEALEEDDVAHAPVAWGADPTEWDGYGDDPPHDGR
jgi:hypothetical protein